MRTIYPILFTLFLILINLGDVHVHAQTHTDFKAKNFPPDKKIEFAKALSAFKDGEKQYKLFKEGKITDPAQAVKSLKTAFEFNPDHIALNRYLTDLLLIKSKNAEALPHLEKLYELKAGLSPMELFLLGSLLQMNEQFFRAEFVFKEFLKVSGDNIFWTEGRLQNATKRIQECIKGQSLKELKPQFSIKTPFLTSFTDNAYEYLYYNHFHGWIGFNSGEFTLLSERQKRTFELPVEHAVKWPYSDINGRITLFSDDSAFYETSGNTFYELSKLNDGYLIKDPYISNDLSTIYFSSNRPGGFGGFDIWIARFSSIGKLIQINNAGKGVNDEYDQFSPVISADEKYFFVSSNGEGTVGGFDIFYALLKDTINNLKNIGFPVNSVYDEEAIQFDITGTKGFIRRILSDSATYIPFRETAGVKDLMLIGSGFESISGGEIKYRDFSIKPPSSFIAEICKLNICIGKHEFGETEIEIFDLKTGKTYFKGAYKDTSTIPLLLPSNRSFGLFATTKNGIFYSENIHFSTGEIFSEKNIRPEFKTIKKGNSVVLDNILFSRDYIEMEAESRFEISRVARWLKERPKIKVEIAVHTDPLSMHGVAIAAGESAAFQVNEMLKSEGIEKKRLDWMFYGSDKPLNGNTNSSSENKRIELIITDK